MAVEAAGVKVQCARTDKCCPKKRRAAAKNAADVKPARPPVHGHYSVVVRPFLDQHFPFVSGSIDGKTFDYKTNERLYKALELKLFEDQKDTIKLTSLVSNVVDADTQAKIDVVKGMNISFVTTARTDEEGRALLQELGLPFRH